MYELFEAFHGFFLIWVARLRTGIHDKNLVLKTVWFEKSCVKSKCIKIAQATANAVEFLPVHTISGANKLVLNTA